MSVANIRETETDRHRDHAAEVAFQVVGILDGYLYYACPRCGSSFRMSTVIAVGRQKRATEILLVALERCNEGLE